MELTDQFTDNWLDGLKQQYLDGHLPLEDFLWKLEEGPEAPTFIEAYRTEAAAAIHEAKKALTRQKKERLMAHRRAMIEHGIYTEPA